MHKLLLSTLLITLSTGAFAQFSSHSYIGYYYPVPRGPKCAEVGYTYPIGTAEFSYRARKYDEGTGLLSDTSFSKRITSSAGFGAYAGYYFPLMRLAEKSRLALTIGYMYNGYLWEGNFFSYSMLSDTLTAGSSPSGGTVEFALPIGFDYKWGSDALFSKSEKLCYSFGAGVFPSMNATIYRDNGGLKFYARPYLKAEAGIFAGLCVKLRLTYLAGKVDYINSSINIPGNFEETKFTSTGTTMFSIIIMPMSWKFSKNDW
ncbi:MAG: hypothetical protein JST06_01760 [Bacteroidetes bacterium]|nr:hypothetical protein [Bacteroidota bacterium]MBS1629053.1 hypothetical protein [Bacteroidota bacterium]